MAGTAGKIQVKLRSKSICEDLGNSDLLIQNELSAYDARQHEVLRA